MNLTLCQSKPAHILITERHANKSKDLYIPTVLVPELSILKFPSIPSKVITGTQKARKYKSAVIYRANDRNLQLSTATSFNPPSNFFCRSWSKQEKHSIIILVELKAQPSYGDFRDNQMACSAPNVLHTKRMLIHALERGYSWKARKSCSSTNAFAKSSPSCINSTSNTMLRKIKLWKWK